MSALAPLRCMYAHCYSPELASVENVVAAVILDGRSSHADYVTARSRFTHGQAAHLVTRNERWEVLFLLRLGAVTCDLVDAQVTVSAVAQSNGS